MLARQASSDPRSCAAPNVPLTPSLFLAVTVAATATWPLRASAQSAQPPETAAADQAASPFPVDRPPATPAAEGPRTWTLEYGGRLFVRDTLSRVDVAGDPLWRHNRDIEQAPVFATYERDALRLALEIELADGAELKDTYIRITPVRVLRLQAGRFKAPVSFIGLESKWSLPAPERGVLSELKVGDLDLPFAGFRADGVSLELRPPVPLRPRLTLAAFQNLSATSASATPLDPSEDITQDLFARIEVEPSDDLHLALAFGSFGFPVRAGEIESYQHLPFAGLEGFADAKHLRLWAEGYAGRSFFYLPDGSVKGAFLAGRVMIALRFRRPFGALWRLEPFVSASALDPTGDRSGDRVFEATGGLGAGFTRHWRLQLEAAQRFAEGIDSPVADSTLIRIQLGARFFDVIPR